MATRLLENGSKRLLESAGLRLLEPADSTASGLAGFVSPAVKSGQVNPPSVTNRAGVAAPAVKTGRVSPAVSHLGQVAPSEKSGNG